MGNSAKNSGEKQVTQITRLTAYSSADKSDFLCVDSVLSGDNKSVLSKNFQEGKTACVFGGAEIDLLQTDFNGTVLLKIDVVFDGVKLIIP